MWSRRLWVRGGLGNLEVEFWVDVLMRAID